MARCRSPTRSMVWRSLMRPLWRAARFRAGAAMLRRMDRSAGIRLATPADAAAIAAMSRDFIEWGLGWRWTPARVQHAIRDRATNVAVLDVQSEPAAFGIMVYGE